MNLYGYASGDPINNSDPFGLCGVIGAAASVAVGAAIGAATGVGYGWGAAAVDAATGAGCLGALAKFAKARQILRANRAAGKAAEARAALELVEEGNTIVGSQVTVRTSRGNRVVDHRVQDADGNLIAVEVKSGGAKRSAAQKAKDRLIEKEGGVVTGKNAGELAGQPIQVPTVERRVP